MPIPIYINIIDISPIFKKNKYLRIYLSIINRSISETRIKGQGVYYEKHHILPKCESLFPEYRLSKWNKVLLTGREHFICHKLLMKIISEEYIIPMKRALWCMCFVNRHHDRDYKITSREFESIKTEYYKLSSVWSKESRMKASIARRGINNVMYGKTHTDEAKLIIGQYSHERNQGADNPNSKKWMITSPDGDVTIITGQLISFCNDNNLSAWTMANCAKKQLKIIPKGRCKGWKCEYI